MASCIPVLGTLCNRRLKVLTLALLTTPDGENILLGYKKRGFGQGKWNGFGGKVHVGQETILQAANRELCEECGLTSEDLTQVGLIYFEFTDEPQEILEVHVFTSCNYTGELLESDEMRPKWFPVQNIPYESMWADDRNWLPKVLQPVDGRDRARNRFVAYFKFRGHQTILEHTISEVGGEADFDQLRIATTV